MYVKAKKILASELMYAKNFSEDDAIAWLDDVLTAQEKPAAPKRSAAAKKPAAAAPAKAPAKKKTPAAA